MLEEKSQQRYYQVHNLKTYQQLREYVQSQKQTQDERSYLEKVQQAQKQQSQYRSQMDKSLSSRQLSERRESSNQQSQQQPQSSYQPQPQQQSSQQRYRNRPNPLTQTISQDFRHYNNSMMEISSPSPSKQRPLDLIEERLMQQKQSFRILSSIRDIHFVNSDEDEETLYEEEESVHDVWDNQQLEYLGFDLNQSIDPKGNPISFLSFYKARSCLYPTKEEELTNKQIILRAIRLSKGNRRSKRAQNFEQDYQIFLNYDDFDYNLVMKSNPANPLRRSVPNLPQDDKPGQRNHSRHGHSQSQISLNTWSQKTLPAESPRKPYKIDDFRMDESSNPTSQLLKKISSQVLEPKKKNSKESFAPLSRERERGNPQIRTAAINNGGYFTDRTSSAKQKNQIYLNGDQAKNAEVRGNQHPLMPQMRKFEFSSPLRSKHQKTMTTLNNFSTFFSQKFLAQANSQKSRVHHINPISSQRNINTSVSNEKSLSNLLQAPNNHPLQSSVLLSSKSDANKKNVLNGHSYLKRPDQPKSTQKKMDILKGIVTHYDPKVNFQAQTDFPSLDLLAHQQSQISGERHELSAKRGSKTSRNNHSITETFLYNLDNQPLYQNMQKKQQKHLIDTKNYQIIASHKYFSPNKIPSESSNKSAQKTKFNIKNIIKK